MGGSYQPVIQEIKILMQYIINKMSNEEQQIKPNEMFRNKDSWVWSWVSSYSAIAKVY